MARIFHVLIEQDEDRVYIGRVPELRGCVSQGDTLDELLKNIKELLNYVLKFKEVISKSLRKILNLLACKK